MPTNPEANTTETILSPIDILQRELGDNDTLERLKLLSESKDLSEEAALERLAGVSLDFGEFEDLSFSMDVELSGVETSSVLGIVEQNREFFGIPIGSDVVVDTDTYEVFYGKGVYPDDYDLASNNITTGGKRLTMLGLLCFQGIVPQHNFDKDVFEGLIATNTEALRTFEEGTTAFYEASKNYNLGAKSLFEPLLNNMAEQSFAGFNTAGSKITIESLAKFGQFLYVSQVYLSELGLPYSFTEGCNYSGLKALISNAKGLTGDFRSTYIKIITEYSNTLYYLYSKQIAEDSDFLNVPGGLEASHASLFGFSLEEIKDLKARNWGDFLDIVNQSVVSGRPISSELLEQIHSILYRGRLPELFCGLRSRTNGLLSQRLNNLLSSVVIRKGNKRYSTLSDNEVNLMASELADNLNVLLQSDLNPIHFYLKLGKILGEYLANHPFSDGNATTGVAIAHLTTAIRRGTQENFDGYVVDYRKRLLKAFGGSVVGVLNYQMSFKNALKESTVT